MTDGVPFDSAIKKIAARLEYDFEEHDLYRLISKARIAVAFYTIEGTADGNAPEDGFFYISGHEVDQFNPLKGNKDMADVLTVYRSPDDARKIYQSKQGIFTPEELDSFLERNDLDKSQLEWVGEDYQQTGELYIGEVERAKLVIPLSEIYRYTASKTIRSYSYSELPTTLTNEEKKHYEQMDSWTWYEAMFVLNDSKPPCYEEADIQAPVHYLNEYNLLNKALEIGAVGQKVDRAGEYTHIDTPANWRAWFVSKGFLNNEVENLPTLEEARVSYPDITEDDFKTIIIWKREEEKLKQQQGKAPQRKTAAEVVKANDYPLTKDEGGLRTYVGKTLKAKYLDLFQ